MTKRKNVRLSCTTSLEVGECIEALLWTGLWGSTRAAVVERLVSTAVRSALDQKTLSEIADGARAENPECR